MPAYSLLEAAVLPMMTDYQTDLTTHDRAAIEANPGCPFLHWASPSNTVIVFLLPADDPAFPPPGARVPYLFGTADREHLADEVVSMAEYHCKPCNRNPLRLAHYWDGKRLRRLDVGEALRVARVYRAALRHAWDRKPAYA